MQLVIQSARKAFGRSELFAGLSAVVPSGKVTALVGPSGSGKSTLLGILAGLTQLDHGSVRAVDEDGQQHQVIASSVSWVPQGLNLLTSRSVLDNAMIGALAGGSDISQAMRAAVRALTQVGLQRHVRSPARLLSGGELQRLGFARALTSPLPFIFADEPTSSLDSTNARVVAELLHSLRATRTIVIATHDPMLVESAEHVIDVRQMVLGPNE